MAARKNTRSAASGPAATTKGARRGARKGRSSPSGASRRSAKGRPAKPAPKRKSRWRWVRRLLALSVLLGLLGALGLVGLFAYYGRDLPDVASLREYQPPQTTRVLSRDGEIIGESFVERRTVVPMERIPRHLVLCVLAAEDADFYRHEGFDAMGIARAVLRGVLAGRPTQGASTITQQVVKLMLLSPERTLERKVRELILAYRLEQTLTKDEILHLYLNHINFGHGHYGVQEAARFYFDIDVEDLSLAQASLIAGIPQAPARLSPRTHRENAERRQAYVLRQLRDKHDEYWPDLPREDIEAAAETDVVLAPRPTQSELAPEVAAEVRRVLSEVLGPDAYERGGYVVHTTIDPALQRAARAALQEGLRAVDERHRYRGPLRRPRRPPDLGDRSVHDGQVRDAEVLETDDEHARVVFDLGGGHRAEVDLRESARYNPDGLSASAFAPAGTRARVGILRTPDEGPAEARLELGPQGAVVLLDPATRDILALVGGYEGSGFDRALQAQRQPGSTFKPLVYALGVHERRYTPATVLVDAPAVYDRWNPQNYETWRHDGPIRLRPALARSINVVAVRAIEELGPENVASFARQLGVESELDPSLALSLGASEVRPIELANVYATFAAGGRWEPPRLVTRIEGPDGDVALPRRQPPRDVLTPAEAYVVSSLLQSVVSEGTARRGARRLGRPAAGKTGTTNEARDAWFVGYTPNFVSAVWVGFDDRRPLGRRESGGRTALPIWVDVIRAAEGDAPPREFPRPSGIETATIDPETGLLAYEGQENGIEEIFLAGTAPTERARPPDLADTSTFLMEQFGQAGSLSTMEPSPAQPEAPDAPSTPETEAP